MRGALRWVLWQSGPTIASTYEAQVLTQVEQFFDRSSQRLCAFARHRPQSKTAAVGASDPEASVSFNIESCCSVSAREARMIMTAPASMTLNGTVKSYRWQWQGQPITITYEIVGSGSPVLLLPRFEHGF